MNREFLGKVLQTIYLDIYIREDSYIYVQQIKSKETTKFRFPKDVSNLQDILKKLEKLIHPRYTKVIIDSNLDTMKLITQWIDNKYNNFIPKNPIMKVDTMLEMVQVVKYHPKRIDVKKFMANKTIYLTKDLK